MRQRKEKSLRGGDLRGSILLLAFRIKKSLDFWDTQVVKVVVEILRAVWSW